MGTVPASTAASAVATAAPVPPQAEAVLAFWFLPAGSPGHGAPRRGWLRTDEQLDAQVRERFEALIGQAVAGGLRDWDLAGARGTLARILLLDQFTRNAWRNTPRAFAGDALALEAARHLLDDGPGGDIPACGFSLLPLERAFLYMPFEHAEDPTSQGRAVLLFEQLAAEHAGVDSMLDFARRHQAVIARFGRFPHRNAILGRASTPQELEFLSQAGARF
jgi:uncharacterized protein (DUF924 family)